MRTATLREWNCKCANGPATNAVSLRERYFSLGYVNASILRFVVQGIVKAMSE